MTEPIGWALLDVHLLWQAGVAHTTTLPHVGPDPKQPPNHHERGPMPMFDRKPAPPMEAIRWDGTDAALDAIWKMGANATLHKAGELTLSTGNRNREPVLTVLAGVDGAQGHIVVPAGHWIARGEPEHFYPIDDAYLTERFVLVDGVPGADPNQPADSLYARMAHPSSVGEQAWQLAEDIGDLGIRP